MEEQETLGVQRTLWDRIKITAQKWGAFFRPVPGWKKRYREASGGRQVWSVPGRDDVNKMIPWPLEWIPHRLAEDEEDAAWEKGFEFLEATCIETGENLPIGVGVCCLRCGVPLHPLQARMTSGFSPPRCSRCHILVVIA
jgi:hypothetical protein